MVCLRVALLLAAVPLVAKAARAPAKGSPPRGFGSKPKPARTAVSVSLGYEAEKALREACGNIDKGQHLYYESKMREAGSDKSHATRVRVTWDTGAPGSCTAGPMCSARMWPAWLGSSANGA